MNSTLIELLADGEFHSGEELGAVLGVSRAAVWKQLQKLEAMNIPFHSVKGKGYRLPEAVELLDQNRLLAEGFPLQAFNSFDQHLSVGSTNDELMLKAETNDLSRHICFAEMQTGGRGRRGRAWVSPFARNLYFSVLWPFSQGISAIQGLSLAVGLAIQRALIKLDVPSTGLKWPNDLLVKTSTGHAKLGGILIELTGDVTDACQVVIGVGINLDIRPQDLARIDQNAIGVKQLQSGLSRNKVAATLVKELVGMLTEFEVYGFSALKEEWNGHDAFNGLPVKLILPSSEIPGSGCGVNDKGEYVMETAGGKQVFNAGEVSLRLGE